MKRKIISFLILAFLIISFCSSNSFATNANTILIDGRIVFMKTYIINSTTYVPIREFSNAIDSSCTILWNGSKKTAVVTNDAITIEVTENNQYMRVNERYFYLKDRALIRNDRLFVPVRELSKAFGYHVSWDESSKKVQIFMDSENFKQAHTVYDVDDLYWLSRIIHAESGSEPLDGKIAVGNVILNRVRHYQYPDTIYQVIFDSKHGVQFQPAADKSIYKTPSEESIIAAKICLEGYSLSSNSLFFFNPHIAKSSWISRNCSYVMSIGNHSFYS